MLLLRHVELRNHVSISAASVLITAKLQPQRGGETKWEEGASLGRRGHSLPVQLDSTVGTPLCSTSTRSLASCSEINHDFESLSNNSFNKLHFSHTSFQLQYKVWPWLRQTGKEMRQKSKPKDTDFPFNWSVIFILKPSFAAKRGHGLPRTVYP